MVWVSYFYGYNSVLALLYYGICHAIEKTEVTGIDGSHLYKKSKHLQDSGIHVAPLELPAAPITGKESITEVNALDMANNIPSVTSGVIYIYLSTHADHDISDGTLEAPI